MAKKDPINNKIRLVYEFDKQGNPISFISLEHSESQLLLKILQYIKQQRKKDDWVSAIEIVNQFKIRRGTLLAILFKLAGVRRIEIFREGEPVPLLKTKILIKKGLMNPTVNLPRTPKYLKAPVKIKFDIFSSATSSLA